MWIAISLHPARRQQLPKLITANPTSWKAAASALLVYPIQLIGSMKNKKKPLKWWSGGGRFSSGGRGPHRRVCRTSNRVRGSRRRWGRDSRRATAGSARGTSRWTPSGGCLDSAPIPVACVPTNWRAIWFCFPVSCFSTADDQFTRLASSSQRLRSSIPI